MTTIAPEPKRHSRDPLTRKQLAEISRTAAHRYKKGRMSGIQRMLFVLRMNDGKIWLEPRGGRTYAPRDGETRDRMESVSR